MDKKLKEKLKKMIANLPVIHGYPELVPRPTSEAHARCLEITGCAKFQRPIRKI